MNTGRIFVTILSIFVMTTIGCGGTSAQKEVAHLQSEGKQRISDNSSSEADFGKSYGIYINPGIETKSTAEMAKDWPWGEYSEAKRAEIYTKLVSHIDNLSRIFAINLHSGLHLINSKGLQKSLVNAQAFLDSLDSYRKAN